MKTIFKRVKEGTVFINPINGEIYVKTTKKNTAAKLYCSKCAFEYFHPKEEIETVEVY